MLKTIFISQLLKRNIQLDGYTSSGTTIQLTEAADFTRETDISDYISKNSIVAMTIGGDITNIPYTGGYKTFQLVKTITINSPIAQIAEHAFQFSLNLEEIVLNQQITTVSRFAFSHCEKLKTINLDFVNNIEFAAFEHCYALESITVHSSLNIGDHAFRFCTALKTINNFETETFVLGRLCFYGCTSLGIKKIGTNFEPSKSDTQPFIKTGITTLTINTNRKILFCNSASLTTVVFSDTSRVTSIYPHTFENCTSLQTVTFNNELTAIQRLAFANTALTTINLMNVIILEPLAFYKSGVQEIIFNKNIHIRKMWEFEKVIPSNNDVYAEYDDVYVIDDRYTAITFDPTQYMEIEFKKDFRPLEKYSATRFCVFLNETRLSKIKLTSSVSQFDASMFANCTLNLFDIAGNSNFLYEDGSLYSSTKKELLCIVTKQDLVEYTVPSSVGIIGPFALTFNPTIKTISVSSSVVQFDYAFGNLFNMENITFQGSISEIPDGCFFCCHSLKNIIIPSTITSAGDVSFAFCYSLVNLMSNSFEKIGKGCFVGCHKLISVDCSKIENLNEFTFYLCLGNTTYTFGDKLVIISKNAFFMSSITSFTCPANVISIEQQAFSLCKKLTSVTLNSNLVRIGNEAFSGSGVKNIQIPNSVRSIEQTAFDNCKNVSFSFESGGHPLFDVDKNCFIYKATGNLLFTFGDTYYKFTVSNKVREVMPNAFRFRTVKRERNEGGFTLFSGVNTLVIPEVVYDLQDNVTYNPYVKSVCLEGVPMLNLYFPIRMDLSVFVTNKFAYGSYYNYPQL